MSNLQNKNYSENQPQRNLLGVYSYDVSLSFFSGPMDLLLHLVHQQEVPVAEVEMKVICEQYLNIVLQVADKDLERATEFLVIAATLLAIKSKSLLPIQEDQEEDHDPGYDVRFFEDLRARLIAYETCKTQAEQLRELPVYGYDTFSRNDRKVLLPTAEMIAEEEESVNSLSLAFMGLLKRIGANKKLFSIQLESVSVVSYMMRMIDKLKTSSINSFKDFVVGVTANDKSDKKGAIISSFIAILELAKRGVLKAEQLDGRNNFSLTYALRNDQEVGELFSEFDDKQLEDSDKVIKLSDYVSEKSKTSQKNEITEIDNDKNEVNSE